MTARATLFIDADNLSPHLAPALSRAISGAGLHAARTEVFGNDKATRLGAWMSALGRVPALARSLRRHRVPCFPDAADVELMLQIGQQLKTLKSRGDTILIASRDNVLLHCAQRLAGMGLPVFVAHDDARCTGDAHSPRTLILRADADKADARGAPHSRVHGLPEPSVV